MSDSRFAQPIRFVLTFEPAAEDDRMEIKVAEALFQMEQRFGEPLDVDGIALYLTEISLTGNSTVLYVG